jgi:glycosyltransferase involved in cell wall biosynthesis
MATVSSEHRRAEQPLADVVQTTDVNYNLRGKRVAMVSFSGYPEDPRPRRAIDALLGEGVAVDFICLGDQSLPRQEKQGRLDVRRLRIEHRRGGAFSYLYQYAAFMVASAAVLAFRSLTRRYALVYVNNMPDVLVASAVVPKLLGAKVILDQHDPMPELMTTIFGLSEGSFAVRAIKRLEKWSIAFADKVITVNVACRRIFADRSCRAEKIGIVMNAPDDRIFGAEPHSPTLRDRSADHFVIMYHGSIVERNGLDLAVRALALIKPAVPKAKLRIYGKKTTFLECVMADVKELGLESSVEYCGPRSLEALVHEIEKCDLGVVPNQRNAFTDINTPTRIFEYLALGKPVIAPRTPGIQDYFPADSLYFFDSGNSQDLARAIENVYSDPAGVYATVERGQAVFSHHVWHVERHNLLTIVGETLGATISR